MSVDTLQNYKMLADMIPELEELMDTGIVTKSTALSMIKTNSYITNRIYGVLENFYGYRISLF